MVKIVVDELESAALIRFLDRSGEELCSSALVRVEVVRAVARHGNAQVTAARELMTRMPILPLTDEVLDLAATLDPPLLRTLDAIHLVSASLLGEALTAFVTYDTRLAGAARAAGFTVVAPA
jgi:uncharacterized protein